MSEYCNQCAHELGFKRGELAGLARAEDLPLGEGFGLPVICEGCGYILVDNEGNCLGGEACMENHKGPDVKTPA